MTSRATDEGVGSPAGAEVLTATATVPPDPPTGAGIDTVVVTPVDVLTCVVPPVLPTLNDVAAGAGVAVAAIGGADVDDEFPPLQAASAAMNAIDAIPSPK